MKTRLNFLMVTLQMGQRGEFDLQRAAAHSMQHATWLHGLNTAPLFPSKHTQHSLAWIASSPPARHQ
jgi:hypothetical protein